MRYIVGALIAVGLLVVILVLVFSGGSPVGPKPIDLMGLANTGAEVQLVTQGQLVADSQRREIVVSVGRDEAELQIVQGYQGNVIKTHRVANNKSAFATFLRGLLLAGFNKGNNGGDKDERGHCALGERYIYKIINPDGETVQRYWNDNCGVGTFEGDGSLIQTLFQKQIPDYNDLTSDVDLSA